MNEIELALEYTRRRKTNRLKKNKLYRRKARANCFSNLSASDSFDDEQSLTRNIFSINLTLSNEEGSNEVNMPSLSPTDNNIEKKVPEHVDSPTWNYQYLDLDDICVQQEISDVSLHAYTTLGRFSFAKGLINFIRKTNLSKTHANHLVALIQSALPQPNTLPMTYAKILSLLSGNFVSLLFLLRVATSGQGFTINGIFIYKERRILQFTKALSEAKSVLLKIFREFIFKY